MNFFASWLGGDAVEGAIKRFSSKVRELGATAKARLLEAELARSARAGDPSETIPPGGMGPADGLSLPAGADCGATILKRSDGESRAPTRVPNLDISRQRVALYEHLKIELAAIKQDVTSYCTVEDLKTKHPDFCLWSILSDPEIKELADGEPFTPRAYAESLALRKFGCTSKETLKKDRRKLRAAERRDSQSQPK